MSRAGLHPSQHPHGWGSVQPQHSVRSACPGGAAALGVTQGSVMGLEVIWDLLPALCVGNEHGCEQRRGWDGDRDWDGMGIGDGVGMGIGNGDGDGMGLELGLGNGAGDGDEDGMGMGMGLGMEMGIADGIGVGMGMGWGWD